MTAAREEATWQQDLADIRLWRRPWRPLWLITLAVLGGAIYVGAVLGGLTPAPESLRPLAEWWWARG